MVSFKDSKAPSKGTKSTPPSLGPARWVVVQLTPLGEREKNLVLIERSVHHLLSRKLEVFVPAINQKGQDDSLTTWYSDGYIFIKFDEGVGYHKLSETNYFSSVLSSISNVNGERKRIYSLLSDKDLSSMRNGMDALKKTGGHDRQFKEEQEVKIVKGNLRNLSGKISMVYDNAEKVQVFVRLRSINGGGIFLDFPTSYLQKIAP